MVRNWNLRDGNDLDDEALNVLIYYDTCGFDLWESTTSNNTGLFEGNITHYNILRIIQSFRNE